MKIEQGMTRHGRRLVEDFLLPALNDGRYGERLRWVDKDNLYFSIKWSHKNAAKWSLEDTVVFQDWDRMKGHFHPEIKGYYMQAKQRFRAALYKLSTVRKIRCTDKQTKLYQLVLENDKRKNLAYYVMKQKEGENRLQEENNSQEDSKLREGIPTSVIRVNENYIPVSRPMITRIDHQYAAQEISRTKSPTPTDDLLMFDDSMSTSNSSMDSPDGGGVVNGASEVRNVIKDVKYTPAVMLMAAGQPPPPIMVLVAAPPPPPPKPLPPVVHIPAALPPTPPSRMVAKVVPKVEIKSEAAVSRPPQPHIPVQTLPRIPKTSTVQPLCYPGISPMYPITVQVAKKRQLEANPAPVENAEGALNLSKKPLDISKLSDISVSARHCKESYLNAIGLQSVKVESSTLSPSQIKQEIKEEKEDN